MIAQVVARLAKSDLEGLRAALLGTPPSAPTISEYDLNSAARPAPHGLIRAAVLLPIVLRREPTILFTRRTGHLSRHAGQISFPGGRSEAQDASPEQTALRETKEEIGIDPAFVVVAGFLDQYETGTGYAIQPVVGALREGFALVPDPHEVAEIFEVPLSFLLDPANCREETRNWTGRVRRFYIFAYREHEIWGATAAILVDLRTRLHAAHAVAHGKLGPAPVEIRHADRS